jgi:hypothetical protein
VKRSPRAHNNLRIGSVDSEQIRVLEAEFFTLSSVFDGLADRLFSGRIDVPTFERSLIGEIKSATIRAYTVGANGFPTAKHWGSSGLHLRQKYADIHRLVGKISAGELSEAQIRDRLSRHARSIQTAASRSEKITKALDGFDLAKRSLDPQSKHCGSCLDYVTDGFISSADVVPRGVNCECGSHCRCLVIYKKSGNALNPLSLADEINKKDRETSVFGDELLAKIEYLLSRKKNRIGKSDKAFGKV